MIKSKLSPCISDLLHLLQSQNTRNWNITLKVRLNLIDGDSEGSTGNTPTTVWYNPHEIHVRRVMQICKLLRLNKDFPGKSGIQTDTW